MIEKSVAQLKGVGAALELKLSRLAITSIEDLWFHLPLRYQDRTHIRRLSTLRPGDECLIQAKIQMTEIQPGRKPTLICRVSDTSGSITLRFFHFSARQKAMLQVGESLMAFGEVRSGLTGLEMIHPDYQVQSPSAENALQQAHLTPVYPLTDGLNQKVIRKLIHQALEYLTPQQLPDLLPESIRQKYKLPELVASIHFLHAPEQQVNLNALETRQEPHQRRLALEELLAHHLSLLRVRQHIQAQSARALPDAAALERQFLQQLPFELTRAQKRVIEDIKQDLQTSVPMLRLVQGDVGSGKTLVAAMAALQALQAGYQVAVMAPTEILAEQHYNNFKQWLDPLHIEVVWLVGKIKGKAREVALNSIRSGAANLIVGTHALFQAEVEFAHLALVIIDEQHRFGVHQRLSLRAKGSDAQMAPHQLIMTATPIPRTLTMSAYADLDSSVIDELPPGRTPIKTLLIADSRRDEMVARVKNACQEGRQAYWVCTLIDESEVLECQAAEATWQNLSAMLVDLRIGLLHGRMKPVEKAAVMQAFKEHALDLLVATTVIEVGVDVPNASLMIIENPERLGLAQLHQLRGRVGRGVIESFCVLMYHQPLSYQGKRKLQIMRETNDGFRIAEEDLLLRGPGDVLGTRQTGELRLRIADLEKDADLLPIVKQLAEEISSQQALIAAIIERWIGQSEVYAQV